MNLGTLFSYAKDYNKDKYNLYFNYFIPLNKMTKGAMTIAECICPKLERHLKWSNEKWFMFYRKPTYGWKRRNRLILSFK